MVGMSSITFVTWITFSPSKTHSIIAPREERDVGINQKVDHRQDHNTICQATFLFLNRVMILTSSSLFSTMLNPPNCSYKSAEYN